MRGALALLALLTLSSPAFSQEETAAREDIFRASGVILEGTVRAVREVPAPIQDGYFAGETKALALTIITKKVWKGQVSISTVWYSWIPSRAPCPDLKFELKKSYIFWGDWDASRRIIAFDDCRSFAPSAAEETKPIREQLDTLFPAKKK